MPVTKKTVANSARVKATPKKAVPAKRTAATKAPAKKAASSAPPAKRPVGRPRKNPEAAPVVKETKPRAAKKKIDSLPPLAERKKNTDPRKRVGGMSYQEISDVTGFGLGTQNLIVAVELLRGGADRREINDRVADLLPPTTRSGNPKQASNLVSSVMRRMIANGFTVKSTWSMIKP